MITVQATVEGSLISTLINRSTSVAKHLNVLEISRLAMSELSTGEPLGSDRLIIEEGGGGVKELSFRGP